MKKEISSENSIGNGIKIFFLTVLLITVLSSNFRQIFESFNNFRQNSESSLAASRDVKKKKKTRGSQAVQGRLVLASI